MLVFKMGGRGGTRSLPLRTVLVVLALVPSVALAGLWALSTYQLGSEWREQAAQGRLTASVGGKSEQLLSALQKERRLTAEALADPAASRDDLATQRGWTDRAVAAFAPLTGLDTSNGQPGLKEALASTVKRLTGLAGKRHAVDDGAIGQQKAYEFYTAAVVADLEVVTALSGGANGQVSAEARTLVELYGVAEMVSREDAVLARGWKSGTLPFEAYDLAVDSIGTQEYLLEYRVEPSLTGHEAELYRNLADSALWKTKRDLEEDLIGAVTDGTQGGRITVPLNQAQWRLTIDQAVPELETVVLARVDNVTVLTGTGVERLRNYLIAVSVLGLLTVLAVIGASWRLTTVLRRRILTLRDEAAELQDRLPDVVARLERGEDVDADAEVRPVEAGGAGADDELGELARALNLAARSAVATAVRQAEQHRGFERLLQRIARRTQLLIGLQLKKLDQMERRHEDPAVLEGLFDLDHLTARLRRYEENLVILGGGQPQRRWRRPVPLLDLLRAAQGEVQDYQRITVEVEGRPWVSEWAVGALTHILAELMENAAAFSKPPTPVDVRAARVGRGIAVEIEDRGLGMTPEQYADANALMLDPPQLDVMTRADDARLGLSVVARLSAGLGVQVELRPSAFGGTRVIVLVPERYVAEAPEPLVKPRAGRRAEQGAGTRRHSGPRPPSADDADAVALAQQEGRLPVRTRGRAMAEVVPAAEPPAAADPLPQRVRRAGLAPELREPDTEPGPGDEDFTPHPEPRRSGAAIGAFQRQSRRSRAADGPANGAPQHPHPSSPTTEDRR